MDRLMERCALPGQMRSQSLERDRRQPRCASLHSTLADGGSSSCALACAETLPEQARIAAESFRLQLQFTRAHGRPKGEVTMFLTTVAFDARHEPSP
jgi:hypothetical protein